MAVVPVSTYRVQLRPPADDHPGFRFDDAARVVPYLARLGVTHLYCSPWLQASPGSAHGYDVVDHSRVNEELGGEEGLQRLVAACREHGLGIVLDVVPNHAGVSAPEQLNPAWWSVLREGRDSPYAAWFDVDWSQELLVPVLGTPLGECLDEIELLDDRIRYYEHELPLAPGTRVDGDLLATLERQHYRLAYWKTAEEDLGYRRFFDVTTLAGLRVEDPDVFAATHEVVLRQVRAGVVDGLRIDHPDGLADPAGYLERLAEATDDAWVVVEKILEPGEQLPSQWRTAGTTGYDALHRLTQLFVDPAGEAALTRLWQETTGEDAPYEELARAARIQAVVELLGPEVERLVALAAEACEKDLLLRDTTRRGLRESLVELLACFPVYRAYLPPQGPADDVARAHVAHAVEEARKGVPHRERELEVWRRLVLAEGPPAPELVTRFQQTCGPAMAKGVEDTAFYRYGRLLALNEVGGDPGRFGLPVEEFHAACEQTARDWPHSMTTLSTHDTKRSADVRARLLLLSECPQEWASAVTRWREAAERHRGASGPSPADELLVWQTLVGAWPIDAGRATAYVEKATREAKRETSWLRPDEAYDADVRRYVEAVLADDALRAEVEELVRRLEPAWVVGSLAQVAVQLTMPGVADTYQGSELHDLSLVDPDNRRPVDYERRVALLDELDGLDAVPLVDAGGRAKLHLVRTALKVRRAHRDPLLNGAYEALPAGPRAVAFVRGGSVVTVAPVRPLSVVRDGWNDEEVTLPDGTWLDELTGQRWSGGTTRLASLLERFPVALLVKEG